MYEADRLVGGSDIGLVVRMRKPIEPDRMFQAYVSLLGASPQLRTRFDVSSGKFAWVPFTPPELAAQLDLEAAAWSLSADAATHASQQRPLVGGLPVTIRRIDETHFYFSMQHAWGDGASALHWLDCLLAAYDGQGSSESDIAVSTRHLRWRDRFRSLLAFFLHLATSQGRARKSTRNLAVLSGPQPPTLPNRDGFAYVEATLPSNVLAGLHKVALQQGSTLTQLLCARVAASLFSQASADHVLLGVPVALAHRPKTARAGNYVSTLPVAITRGEDALSQVARAFKWEGRGFPIGFNLLLEHLTRRASDHGKLSKSMSQHFRLAHSDPARGYLKQYSALVSNLGRVSGRHLRQQAESVSIHGKFEFLAFGFAQLNGSLTLTAIAPRNAFDEARVRATFSELASDLEQLSSAR